MCWNIRQRFQSESFPLSLVKHHSYKNEQGAIQGYNAPSRECTTIQSVAGAYNLYCSRRPKAHSIFCKDSNCAEHATVSIFQTRACIRSCSQKKNCRKWGYFQDARSFEKMLKIQQSLSACFNFAFRFHAKNISFFCSVAFLSTRQPY